jgi:hypothetical protein
MKHKMVIAGDLISVWYDWKQKGSWNSIQATAESSLSPIEKGTEEEFIFEHYWGYSAYDKNTTLEYGVEHDVWQVYPVKEWSFDCDIASNYGTVFVPFLTGKPSSVFMAKGSDVLIRKPRFISELSTNKKDVVR